MRRRKYSFFYLYGRRKEGRERGGRGKERNTIRAINVAGRAFPTQCSGTRVTGAPLPGEGAGATVSQEPCLVASLIISCLALRVQWTLCFSEE